MMRSIAYVADISQDIDDLVTIYALRSSGRLGCVVLDRPPTDDIGAMRVKKMVEDGIPLCESIPGHQGDVFVGGSLGKVAEYVLSGGEIANLVVNGGFVGKTVVPDEDALPKFAGKASVRTYNFDLDVDAADAVLRSTPEQIGRIFLVGKNVCHDARNTPSGIWASHGELLDGFALGPHKRLHDLLMAYEGLALVGLSDHPLLCRYEDVYPYNEGLQGNMTRWGSSRAPTGYRRVTAATGWCANGQSAVTPNGRDLP